MKRGVSYLASLAGRTTAPVTLRPPRTAFGVSSVTSPPAVAAPAARRPRAPAPDDAARPQPEPFRVDPAAPQPARGPHDRIEAPGQGPEIRPAAQDPMREASAHAESPPKAQQDASPDPGRDATPANAPPRPPRESPAATPPRPEPAPALAVDRNLAAVRGDRPSRREVAPSRPDDVTRLRPEAAAPAPVPGIDDGDQPPPRRRLLAPPESATAPASVERLEPETSPAPDPATSPAPEPATTPAPDAGVEAPAGDAVAEPGLRIGTLEVVVAPAPPEPRAAPPVAAPAAPPRRLARGLVSPFGLGQS